MFSIKKLGLLMALLMLPTTFVVATLAAENVSPKHEMRAAWIATVANIDWPSKEAVGHPELQKKEMLAILDSVQALKMNMVIFQIRPTADALYQSELEPWSGWLTGKQGAGQKPAYDPLTFVCQEAHKRCIDVHVWLNPYRVTQGFTTAELASSHVYNKHRDWFVKYGKQWYFNPGLDETRQWLCKVAADIVRRYDVDGLHFDDYFYPYRIAGEEFPDAATFKKYPRGFSNKEAWRRNNVDMVIGELHDTIKAIKPWVEFGISPFGVWRNAQTDPERGSQTKAGVQNYDDLYADILLWLEKGWIDYVVPQLYWEIGKTVADYEHLAHWWAQYSYGRNLYIGQSVSSLGHGKADAWHRPNEICRQLRLNRSIPEVQGAVFFPVHSVLQNPQGLCDSLRQDYYRLPALLPSVAHDDSGLRSMVNGFKLEEVTALDSRLSWQPVEGAARYVVYAFPSDQICDFDDPQYILSITASTSFITRLDPEQFTFCVTSIDRYHHESFPSVL